MSAKPAQSPAPAPAAPERNSAHTTLCFVIDGDASMRHFVSLILRGSGIDTEEFVDSAELRAALQKRPPDLVFLDIPLESSDAIACVVALGAGGYRGQVQLMSNRGSAVLAHVKDIGEQKGLQMLPVLRKPFETTVILKVLQNYKLGPPPAAAGRVDLDEALSNNWIEFWYQPKIDLRRKQLVGAEAFARARHPSYGLLLPSAFVPGANDTSLLKLSEMALTAALKAGLRDRKLGVNLRMAVNIPVKPLVKLPVADIVQNYKPQWEKWPGLIIDVPEEQIVTDLALA